MTLLTIRLKRVSVFIYILLVLIAFTILFNLYSRWEGISLIVRVYIYVFSFYLIFNFSTANLDRYESRYQVRFGKWAEEVLFFEVRVLPFILIYCIIILFAMADGVRREEWPWSVLMNLLSGGYVNLMVYALFLLFVLKLKKDPFFTIPIFLALCVLYFYLDLLIDSVLSGGLALQLMLLLKFVIFFFFIFVEFFVRRRLYKLFSTAAVVSLVFYVFYIGSYKNVFNATTPGSYPNTVSGLHLLRLGFSSPVVQLQEHLKASPDIGVLRSLIVYSKANRVKLLYADSEWEKLMFHGGIEMADMVAEYLHNENIKISYRGIIKFAESVSEAPDAQLENWSNFIKIAAKNIKGNERDFRARLGSGNKKFIQWCIAVAGETSSLEYVPVLLEYLTSIDINLSETAYISLTRITGLDPREKLNRRKNDPAVLMAFKEYYLHNRRKG